MKNVITGLLLSLMSTGGWGEGHKNGAKLARC